MKTDSSWGTFMMTGRVTDYLEYKKQDEYTSKVESVRGEGRDGEERYSHGDGTSNDAYW